MSTQDFTAQLVRARELIAELRASIDAFPLERLMYTAPILDRIRFEDWGQDEVMGLRKWVDGVAHQSRLLDSMAESSVPPKEDPLPSVQGLTTFWKIIITSPPPIVGIRISMGGDRRDGTGAGGRGTPDGRNWRKKEGSEGSANKVKAKEVWVDVVADGGRLWKRIYSKKVSHLLAEFREADSYLNSDYDSDSSAPNSASPTDEQTNSLLVTARDLTRAAASVDRIPGAPAPRLTIHLTRIPSTPEELYTGYPAAPDVDEDGKAQWPDSRFPDTFAAVRSMGIELVFGDMSSMPLGSLKGTPIPAAPIPSLKLNLDITTLMGLCSDVLHHALPTSREEAARRSLRPHTHLLGGGSGGRGRDGTGRGKGKGKKEDENEDEEELRGQSQNSRELYRCILEEMERPFIDEFGKVIQDAWREQRDRYPSTVNQEEETKGQAEVDIGPGRLTINGYKDSTHSRPGPKPHVEFWTTVQAAQYTYEALSSGPAHGHGGEQRRMRRMLGLEAGDFFQGSRYEGKEGIFKDFKVRVFDVDNFVPATETDTDSANSGSSKSTSTLLPRSSPDQRDQEDEEAGIGRTGFHRTLASITQLFLDQYYASVSVSVTSPSRPSTPLPNFLQPKKLPSPPIAKISLPFPVVSLHSLNRGAREGMSTLMMGTATLKEVWGQVGWRVRGWERGWYDWEGAPERQRETGASQRASEDGRVENNAGSSHLVEFEGQRRLESDEETETVTYRREGSREKGHAAVMIFPYRVFGEGKRVRFERGDYSYPTPDGKE